MMKTIKKDNDRYFKRFCNMTDEERNRYYIYADENIIIGGKPEYVMELLETVSRRSRTIEKALENLKVQLKITD